MSDVYELQIELKDTKPKIWRRILVDPNLTLLDFHKILQTTMGWFGGHLHQFSAGAEYYAPKEMQLEDTVDSEKVKINKILHVGKPRITYEYDFGDGWVHHIILKKVHPKMDGQIPRCIEGKRHCPPEDCGGPWGFTELIKILANPKHEEHEEMMEYYGDTDWDYFDMEEVNEGLQSEDYGCFSMF